jgi:hypothetical protein
MNGWVGMMVKTFKHFPQNDTCLLCGTNDDKPCILVSVDGTGDGIICEKKPVHADCMLEGFRYAYSDDLSVIYRRTRGKGV